MFEIRASDRPLTVRPGRTLLACAATGLSQLTLFGLLSFLGHSVATQLHQSIYREQIIPVVFLPDHSGPGGGGGGGGNQITTPPKRAEIPTPRPQEPAPLPEAVTDQQTPTQLNIPVTTLATIEVPGALSDVLADVSQGPGRSGGGGDGDGSGIGPGNGPGLGPGRGGNMGDGPLSPGTGGSDPVPVYRAAPEYTAQAVTARVSGEVWVECTVLPDGACVRARVIRSLDARFGLDRAALKAAERWRFRPGRDKSGRPVSFLVAIAVEFRLH